MLDNVWRGFSSQIKNLNFYIHNALSSFNFPNVPIERNFKKEIFTQICRSQIKNCYHRIKRFALANIWVKLSWKIEIAEHKVRHLNLSIETLKLVPRHESWLQYLYNYCPNKPQKCNINKRNCCSEPRRRFAKFRMQRSSRVLPEMFHLVMESEWRARESLRLALRKTFHGQKEWL